MQERVFRMESIRNVVRCKRMMMMMILGVKNTDYSRIIILMSVGQKGTLSYIPALLIKQDWTTKTMQIIEDK